jgi:hypothetical protein
MNRLVIFPVVLLAFWLSVGCASARRTGSAAKDATVATGREVGPLQQQLR